MNPNDNVRELRMRGIAKAFAGVPALKGVDFTLRGGEIHALLGANGAGKSTLMKILSGANESDEGTIEIDGRSLAGLAPGIAVSYPLTRGNEPQYPSHFLDIPWTLVLGLSVVVPLTAALGAALLTRSRLPLAARVEA